MDFLDLQPTEDMEYEEDVGETEVQNITSVPVPIHESTPEPSKRPGRRRRSAKSQNESNIIDDEVYDDLRMSLTTIIRGVFESEATIATITGPPTWRIVTQFVTLYNKIKDEHPLEFVNIILDELRLRLNYLVGDTTYGESRRRVFAFLVTVAKFLYKEENDYEMAAFLVEYVTKISECDYVNARVNSLKILTLIFQQMVMDPFRNDKGKLIIGWETRNCLYRILRKRQYDKSDSVRESLIYACAEIQDMPIESDFDLAVEKSPKDMIFMGFQDRSPLVRQAAIKCVDIKTCTAYYLNKIANIAGAATNFKIRQEAIIKLGQVRIDQLMDFPDTLQQCFSLTLSKKNPEISEITKEIMLKKWLQDIATGLAEDNGYPTGRKNDGDLESGEPHMALGSALVTFAHMINLANREPECEQIVLASFDCIRWMVYPTRKVNIAELATILTTDKCKPRLWSRYYKGSIKSEDLTFSTMSIHLYLWRCFVTYCLEKTETGVGDDDDRTALRDEALQRLLGPLKGMVEVLQAVWKRGKGESNLSKLNLAAPENRHFMECLVQAIRLCNYCEKDYYSAKKYEALLSEMILNVNLTKPVTDLITETLVDILHPDETKSGLLRCSEHCCCHQFIENLYEKISLPAALIRPDENDPCSSRSLEVTKMSIPMRVRIISYAGQVLHGMLKTNKIHTDNPFIRRTVKKIIDSKWVAPGEVGRCAMFQCLTIAMLANENFARQEIETFESGMRLEKGKSKATLLGCYFDVEYTYGLDQVDIWRGKRHGFIEDCTDIIYMIPEEKTIDPDVQFAACEVAFKALMLDHNKSRIIRRLEIGVTTCLSLLYFRPQGEKNKKFRDMYQQFCCLFMQRSLFHLSRVVYGMLTCCHRMLEAIDQNTRKIDLACIESALETAAVWSTKEILDENCVGTAPEIEIYDVVQFNYVFIYFCLTQLHTHSRKEQFVQTAMRILSEQESFLVPPRFLLKVEKAIKNVLNDIGEYHGPKHPHVILMHKIRDGMGFNNGEEVKVEEVNGTVEPQSTAKLVRRQNGALPKIRRQNNALKRRFQETTMFDVEWMLNVDLESRNRPASGKKRVAKSVRKNFLDELFDHSD